MGEIATSERQITHFYHSKSVRAKQTLAYLKKGIAHFAGRYIEDPAYRYTDCRTFRAFGD